MTTVDILITHAFITGESETKIWGLTGRERLKRMLTAFKQFRVVDDPVQLPEQAPAIILRGDHLFDASILSALGKIENDCLLISDEGQPVAMRISDNVLHALTDFKNRIGRTPMRKLAPLYP